MASLRVTKARVAGASPLGRVRVTRATVAGTAPATTAKLRVTKTRVGGIPVAGGAVLRVTTARVAGQAPSGAARIRVTTAGVGGRAPSTSVTVRVTKARVSGVSAASQASAGLNFVWEPYVPCTLSAVGSVGAVSYAWTGPAGITIQGANTHTATVVFPASKTQTSYVFTLTTTNSAGATATDTVTVIVPPATEYFRSGTTWRPVRFSRIGTGIITVGSAAEWAALWDQTPLGDSGWVAGDGAWPAMHPRGTTCLFAFGLTPILDNAGPVTPTGATLTTTGAAGTATYVTAAAADAAAFPIGARVTVETAAGVLRSPDVHTVTDKSVSGGAANIFLDHPLGSASAAGDVVRGVTGGVARYFPNSSAVLWTPGGGLATVSGVGEFIPSPGDGTWYWPGPMLAEGNRLFMFATHQGPPPTPNPSNLPWTNLGRSLMMWRWVDAGDPPAFMTKVADLDPAISWGAAVVTTGSWTYIYGTYQQAGWQSNRVYCARVPAGAMATPPSAWQFWVTAGGGSWATGASNLTSTANLLTVISEATGTEGSFSAAYVNGKYRLCSKLGGTSAAPVTLWESTSPTTGFVSRTIANAPYGSPTAADQTYNAGAHFQIRTTDGKALAAWSRNQTGRATYDYYNNPTWYRPAWSEFTIT